MKMNSEKELRAASEHGLALWFLMIDNETCYRSSNYNVTII